MIDKTKLTKYKRWYIQWHSEVMWGDTAHDTESNIKCDISSSNAHYININVVASNIWHFIWFLIELSS